VKKTTAVIMTICIVLIGSGVAFAMTNNDISNIFFRAGQIERENLNANSNYTSSDSLSSTAYFVKNNDFTILESEITKIDEQYKLTGIQDGRECAIKFLLKREILYTEALAQGFYASDKEVRALVEQNITAARTAENYESDFNQFLNAIGMTDVEYWESQYDVFKKEIAISKLVSAEHESIVAKSRLADQEMIQNSVQKYLDEVVDDYIKANDLQWTIYPPDQP